MAEALLARIVPPVSTPFGHPVVNEHYYTQAEELSGTANGAPEKITPLRYLNQYVDDVTAQRLSKEREQSAQQQRTASQVNAKGLPVRGLPQGVQSDPRPVNAKAANASASRSAPEPSSRPQSAQQILDGLSQMSNSQPKPRGTTSIPRAAVTTNPHVRPEYSDGSAQPLDLNDPYVMESSPSKGRSSQTPARPNGSSIPSSRPSVPQPSRTPMSVQKPKAPHIDDGFRSPEVSDGEEDEGSEDAEGELEEEDGDTYTPGNTRAQTVIDSGRPEKVTASVRSSVRPSSSKIGQYLRILQQRVTDQRRIPALSHRSRSSIQGISGGHL